MKHPDFDKAFAPTPEIVRLSIEDAFRKGEKAMKLRHKITAMVSAAAVLAVVCAAAVFALPSEPRPDVVSQPMLTEPTEEPVVYYTEKGVYYHNIEVCSGMLGAKPHGLLEAQTDGKIACPACVKGEVETSWNFDEAELITPEPEVYGGSILMDADGTVIELESQPFSTLTPRVTAEPTPGPEEFNTEEQIVYHTEQGKYFHVNMHCSGMMNAKAHPIAEAQSAGKIPCPVCVTELTAYSTVDPSIPDSETPFYDSEADAGAMEETPAKFASDIFTNVFGVYLFDALKDFEYISANSYGVHSTDGLLTEEIEFCFAQDGWQFAPVNVTVESQDDEILSGRIILAPDAGYNFDWPGFYEKSSPWFQKVCENIPATLDMLTDMDAAFEDNLETITQVYVYFDSETKPSVCSVDFSTYFGFFSLGFDIAGDDVSLATMNYNVSKA